MEQIHQKMMGEIQAGFLRPFPGGFLGSWGDFFLGCLSPGVMSLTSEQPHQPLQECGLLHPAAKVPAVKPRWDGAWCFSQDWCSVVFPLEISASGSSKGGDAAGVMLLADNKMRLYRLLKGKAQSPSEQDAECQNFAVFVGLPFPLVLDAGNGSLFPRQLPCCLGKTMLPGAMMVGSLCLFRKYRPLLVLSLFSCRDTPARKKGLGTTCGTCL